MPGGVGDTPVHDQHAARARGLVRRMASVRSFTQAALDLHIAQSALSQQVGRLERELGVELLRRTTRRVAVTEAGELVLARARRALAEADAVRADLDALQGLARGTLRLGGVPPVGSVHPAALIADFARAHQGLAVTVREDVALRCSASSATATWTW